MRRLTISLTLICMLLANGVTSQARKTNLKQTKSRTERKAPKSSAAQKQVARRARESARERTAQRELLKRNPRLAGLFKSENEAEMNRFDQPQEALEWYLKKRLPKGEKQLPIERYFEAKEKIKKMKRFSSRGNKNLPPAQDTEELLGDGGGGEDPEFPNGTGGGGAGDGSASTSGALGTWQSIGPGNVGGRTRALVIDPVDTDTMYAAGVAGGVWKTTNAGSSWSPLNDFLANIAVTVLALDPTDHNTIYAGTGEGFFNADGVRGAGIFKSSDAGLHWTRLASTASNANFFFISDIVVSPVNGQHVYASTRTGVWRSLDGGANWTQVIVSNAANGANGAMDLAIRTDQATDYVYAAVGTFARSHIFRNTDAGGAGTWVDVFSDPVGGRTSLAISPSNQNVIYAMVACISCGAGTNPNFPAMSYTDGLLGVFRSTSSGDAGSWTTQVRNNSANIQDTLLLSNPVIAVSATCGFGPNQFLNQGWYDNVIAVDPTDSNRVWIGGIDLFRSDNGGVNWGVASYWWFQGNGTPPNNGDPQLVHADNHVLVFHPNYNGSTNQTLLVGDDGGIYKTNNAGTGNVGYVNGITPAGGTITSSSPICGSAFAPGALFTVPSPVTWEALNNNYAVTQFYHGLPYPNGQTYFGGAQDNGTNRGTDGAGPNAWERVNGGDGGYVAVNPANTATIFFETTGLSLRRSTNGGGLSSSVISGISDAFPFITVFRMDPNTPTRLWIGGQFMWRTDNNATNWTRTSNQPQTGGSITAMAIAPGTGNVVIDGAASGQLRRTTIGLTANAASVLNTVWLQSFTPRGNGNGTISWVEYDPSNANNVWATISNFNGTPNVNGTSAGHVFKSTNGGATWTLADGTQTAGNVNAIPDIPAHAVVVDPNDSQRIYVGTDLGVFVSLDGGANWARETTGFSNTVVESLSAVNNNGVTSLFAFTHGRGAFKVTIPTSCATVSPTTQAFFSPGNTGSVTVTKNLSATAPCSWNAVSNNSFITIDSGASGTNNGTVNFTVAPNTTGAARAGTLTVAGRTVTITQDAAPTANNDTATTDEDTPVDINVLANDVEPDGDTLNITSVTQGTNGAVSVNPNKTIHYAPAPNFFGSDSFTYTIDDGHGATSTATVNVTVNAVNDAPVFAINLLSQTVQYSDPITTVTVSVSDVDDPTSSLTLSVLSSLPAGLTVTPTGVGSLTISGNPLVVAGVYNINLQVSDPHGATTNATVTINVNKETAETAYTGDMGVITAGPTITTATIRLAAHLTQDPDGAPGDITLARVTFEIFKSTNLTDTPDTTVSNVPVDSNGDAFVLLPGVAPDTYVVKVKIDATNGFWTADPVGLGTINVAVGTDDQRVAGGGWVPDADSANARDNFGFTVHIDKKNLKGNSIFIIRGTDGFNYIVKSTSWGGGLLNFSNEPGTSIANRASFAGKCTVQKIDRATGALVASFGNFSFTVDVRDGDLLTPPQGDAYAITILDTNGVIWRRIGTNTSLIPIGGGNVNVKAR